MDFCRKKLWKLSTLSRSCPLSACLLCRTKIGCLLFLANYQGASSVRSQTSPQGLTICGISYFLTASYDGAIRAFDYSQKLLHTSTAHSAPISSICIIPPQPGSMTDDSVLVGSASQDLTARITRIDLPASGTSESKSRTLASLHLHTAPVSSVSASPSGSHLLTSSWDGLIGLWDTSTPATDEVPEDEVAGGERKKRRKIAQEDSDVPRPKRKAPTAVLKSHTARVSRVIFGPEAKGAAAYSCGFDSTVRTWDVENGVCTNTIVRASCLVAAILTNANAWIDHLPYRLPQQNRSWTSRSRRMARPRLQRLQTEPSPSTTCAHPRPPQQRHLSRPCLIPPHHPVSPSRVLLLLSLKTKVLQVVFPRQQNISS